MRWALIESGHVVNVVEQDGEPAIAGIWVPCGDAGPGWSYDGDAFTAPLAQQAVATVTRRQALRALHAAGLLDDIEAAINALPEPQQSAARIDWESAAEFRRDFPLLVALAGAIGLSESDIDDLFAAAAAIT